MSKGKISILIAAYNEENNIDAAIVSIKRILPDAEIVIVDDGSTDRTAEKAKCYEDDSVKVFTTQHMGKGNAIRKAIHEASGSIMAQVDADMQFPAQGLPGLIKPILDGKADIVFGSRYLNLSAIEKGSVSPVKRLASFIMAGIVSIICRQYYTDVFAGFKAWRTDVINSINIKEKSFSYEAEIAIKAKRKGYSVIEVPTSYKRRVHGESKIRVVYHTFLISWRIIKLTFFAR